MEIELVVSFLLLLALTFLATVDMAFGQLSDVGLRRLAAEAEEHPARRYAPFLKEILENRPRFSFTLSAAIQIFLPLRHLLYRGGVEWTVAEHRFSWRMLIITYASVANFYVTDPNSGRSTRVRLSNFLTPRQAPQMGYLPDLPLQFAHYLASVMPRSGPKPLQVQARIFVSINGRKPVLYIDPIVDLAAERRTIGRPWWLLRNDQPLPPPDKRYLKFAE